MAIKEMICRLSEQAVQNTQQGSALAIQRSAETLIHRIPAGVYCYPVTAERMEPACFISDGMLRIFECTRDLFYEKYGGCVRRRIYPADEQRLDRYEGYPSYYIKAEHTVHMTDGSEIKGMIYLMNHKRVAPPTQDYYEGIRRAYQELGFRSEIERVLKPALLRSLARKPG